MDDELAPFLKSYASWPKYFKKWHTEAFVPIVTVLSRRLTAPSSTAPVASIGLSSDDDTVSVAQGSSVAVYYTPARNGGQTGTITLTISGEPSGITTTYPDGQTWTGSDVTPHRALFTASSGATTVSNDAILATASASGVSDATDSGTITITSSAGDPSPGVGATLLVDTRSGGEQSWQGHSITNVAGALSAVANKWSGGANPYVASTADWYPTVGAFATDADGTGTSAIRSDTDRWDQGGAGDLSTRDGGGDEWSIVLATPYPSEVYVQVETWLSRTATSGFNASPTNGGPTAVIGQYTVINQNAYDIGDVSGFKFMHFWASAPGTLFQTATSYDESRSDWLWGGGAVGGVGVIAPQLTYNAYSHGWSPVAEGAVFPDVSSPYAPNGAVPANSTWHKQTFYYKAASSETASDGVVKWWLNGTLVMSKTDVDHGNYPFKRLSWTSTHRCVQYNSVEMHKNLLIWTP